MKCNKCGKEADLRDGLCAECYKEVQIKKHKRRSKKDPNYVLNKLDANEKVISKLEVSNFLYACIVVIFGIAIILFPKTILEFFLKKNYFYFPILIGNIAICFIGIYTSLYFWSRQVYLTNKRIIGKWGLFKVRTLDAGLNKIESIDTYKINAVEIIVYGESYVFDFVQNAEKFKNNTIDQIKKLIDSAENDKTLSSFSHSINSKLEEYLLNQEHPNMTYCKCCGEMISKESLYCVHCGQPIPENEKEADWILKIFCFILFPLGFLLFIINAGDHSKLANQCLAASLLGLFSALAIYLSVANIFAML